MTEDPQSPDDKGGQESEGGAERGAGVLLNPLLVPQKDPKARAPGQRPFQETKGAARRFS